METKSIIFFYFLRISETGNPVYNSIVHNYWLYIQIQIIWTLRGHRKCPYLITGCPFYRGEFEENVGAFFPQGQSKLSVILRCPN